jgi:hypothetical protein
MLSRRLRLLPLRTAEVSIMDDTLLLRGRSRVLTLR